MRGKTKTNNQFRCLTCIRPHKPLNINKTMITIPSIDRHRQQIHFLSFQLKYPSLASFAPLALSFRITTTSLIKSINLLASTSMPTKLKANENINISPDKSNLKAKCKQWREKKKKKKSVPNREIFIVFTLFHI